MIDSNDLAKMHNRLLEIAKITCRILEQNNIPYMIAFGNLLGAVRHKGFIPWDDDFDIIIFDDIYDNAIECLRSELPDSMFLEDEKSEPMFFHAWARIRDTNSEISCNFQDSFYSHKGIIFDVLRAKRMKKCEVMQFVNDHNRRYINRRREKSLISNEEYEHRMQMLEIDEDVAKNSTDSDQTEVFALPIPIRYKNAFISASDVFPLKKYQFEDAEFFGPANAENILRNIYGDFMQLPPPEERIPTHLSWVKFLNEGSKD